MKKLIAGCGVAVLAAVLPVAAGGQDQQGSAVVRQRGVPGGGAVIVDQTRGPGEIRVKVPLEAKIVTGAPYSAEVVNESVQVLPDGNRIVRQERSRVLRDGQGRIRREAEYDGRVVSVSITDPVDGVTYSLDPNARVAWMTPFRIADGVVHKAAAAREFDPAEVERKRLVEKEILETLQRKMEEGAPPPPPPPPLPVPDAGAMRERDPGWEEKTEDLAPRQIEGVQAVGKRTTRTIPAGAVGNERPIVIVSEEWRSPELQVLLLTTTSDPRVGESVHKLVNISRTEPAASLFEVPSDYTVRETGIRRPPAER